jgi:plasmid stabilization system protein ParE
LEEYRDAALWYAEREPQVAQNFVASVEEVIARIVAAPQRWRVVDEDVRRCLTRVFPFGVLYTLKLDFLLIMAGHALEPRAWSLESENHRTLVQQLRAER